MLPATQQQKSFYLRPIFYGIWSTTMALMGFTKPSSEPETASPSPVLASKESPSTALELDGVLQLWFCPIGVCKEHTHSDARKNAHVDGDLCLASTLSHGIVGWTHIHLVNSFSKLKKQIFACYLPRQNQKHKFSREEEHIILVLPSTLIHFAWKASIIFFLLFFFYKYASITMVSVPICSYGIDLCWRGQ